MLKMQAAYSPIYFATKILGKDGSQFVAVIVPAATRRAGRCRGGEELGNGVSPRCSGKLVATLTFCAGGGGVAVAVGGEVLVDQAGTG